MISVKSKQFAPLEFQREQANFRRFVQNGVIEGMLVQPGSTNFRVTINGGYLAINGLVIHEDAVQNDAFNFVGYSHAIMDHYLIYVHYNPAVDVNPYYDFKVGSIAALAELTVAEAEHSLVLADVWIPNGGDIVVVNRLHNDRNFENDFVLSFGEVFATVGQFKFKNAELSGIDRLTDRSSIPVLKYIVLTDTIDIDGYYTLDTTVSGFGSTVIIGKIDDRDQQSVKLYVTEVPGSPTQPYDEIISGEKLDNKDTFVIATITHDTVTLANGSSFPVGEGIVNGVATNYIQSIISTEYGTVGNPTNAVIELDDLLLNVDKLRTATLDTAYDGFLAGSSPGDGRTITVDAGPVQLESRNQDQETSIKAIFGSSTYPGKGYHRAIDVIDTSKYYSVAPQEPLEGVLSGLSHKMIPHFHYSIDPSTDGLYLYDAGVLVGGAVLTKASPTVITVSGAGDILTPSAWFHLFDSQAQAEYAFENGKFFVSFKDNPSVPTGLAVEDKIYPILVDIAGDSFYIDGAFSSDFPANLDSPLTLLFTFYEEVNSTGLNAYSKNLKVLSKLDMEHARVSSDLNVDGYARLNYNDTNLEYVVTIGEVAGQGFVIVKAQYLQVNGYISSDSYVKGKTGIAAGTIGGANTVTDYSLSQFAGDVEIYGNLTLPLYNTGTPANINVSGEALVSGNIYSDQTVFGEEFSVGSFGNYSFSSLRTGYAIPNLRPFNETPGWVLKFPAELSLHLESLGNAADIGSFQVIVPEGVSLKFLNLAVQCLDTATNLVVKVQLLRASQSPTIDAHWDIVTLLSGAPSSITVPVPGFGAAPSRPKILLRDTYPISAQDFVVITLSSSEAGKRIKVAEMNIEYAYNKVVV